MDRAAAAAPEPPESSERLPRQTRERLAPTVFSGMNIYMELGILCIEIGLSATEKTGERLLKTVRNRCVKTGRSSAEYPEKQREKRKIQGNIFIQYLDKMEEKRKGLFCKKQKKQEENAELMQLDPRASEPTQRMGAFIYMNKYTENAKFFMIFSHSKKCADSGKRVLSA